MRGSRARSTRTLVEAAIVSPRIDAFAELQAAAELLFARWTLAVPTAIASLVAGMLLIAVLISVVVSAIGAAAMSGHGGAIAALLGAGALTALGTIVAIVAVVGLAQAIVIAAAEDAWQGHAPDFARALGRTLARSPALVELFVLALLIALIPLALSVVLIGIPLLLAVGYLLMFALPAVIVGGESATAAIATSFRLASTHAGPALIAFVGIVVASVLGRIADVMFLHIPLIGLVVTFLVGGFTSAYGALVAVRFYDLLRDVPHTR